MRNMFVKREMWYPNINKTRNRHGKEFIMNIVTAIDSFKGSMTSMEAGQAAAEGIQRVDVDAEVIVRPLADGGEGTVEALVSGMNGTLQKVQVTGPLGEPVICEYGIIESTKTAVIEMAGAGRNYTGF